MNDDQTGERLADIVSTQHLQIGGLIQVCETINAELQWLKNEVNQLNKKLTAVIDAVGQ